MSSHPSARMLMAMELIRSGKMTPYQAAIQVGLETGTVYRSKLYKDWVSQGKPGYKGASFVKETEK